jgi:glycosyltransferase involved in cell wall biosynthesis
MEALNIETCLRSVAGWSADIHVVDSGSTDETVEIARRFAHNVHSHPYVDHTRQIKYVLSELDLKHDWLLLLDADHEVSQELKENIESMLVNGAETVDLYYYPQTLVFRGQIIRSFKKWGRLLRHRNVEVEGGELVDFRYSFPGAVGFLRGHVVERNLKEDDLDFWIDKHQKFAARTSIEEALRRSGQIRWSIRPRLFGNPDQRTVWLKQFWQSLPLFVRPFLYFGYRYVWKRGFLEGKTGFLFHFLQAFWFRMIVDVKLGDLERQIAAGELRISDLQQGAGHHSPSLNK